MSEEIPRRLRRFYRSGEQEEYNSQNEVEKNQEVPTKSTPVNQPEQSRATSMAISELKNKTKSEAIALTMHEIRRFMRENNRAPQTDEQDEIAENLYHQLKSDLTGNEKGSSVADRARARAAQKVEEKKPKETIASSTDGGKNSEQKMDFSDLLKDDNNSNKKAQTLDELELDLSALDLPGDSSSSHANENVVIEQENAPGNCPHCNRPTDSPVYCPNCGNAFCPNCAKQALNQADKILYTCPACNHAFSTRKR